MVCRAVQFVSCLGRATRRSILALFVGVVAAGGCARGSQPVASPQPFRDERDPGAELQFHEGAVPAEDEKSESAEATSETTIEIDIDEESADSTSTEDGAAASDDSSDDDDSSGDEDVSGEVEDEATGAPAPAR